jgi:cell surface protein SprA
MRIIKTLLLAVVIPCSIMITFSECTHYAVNPVPPTVYIDNFEASKLTVPLGVSRCGWVQASIPVAVLNDPTNPLPPDGLGLRPERGALARRGTLFWYNPFHGLPTRAIYPNRDVDAGSAITQVLFLTFTPIDSVRVGLAGSWGGVMRALPPSFFNQTESKFLEIWFKGTKGRLHIDLGQVAEDIIPDRRLNTEDTFGGIRNGILDAGEDVGLEGVAGKDPADFWDLNGNAKRNWGEPASKDDWFYRFANEQDQYATAAGTVNGTENSKNDATAGGAIRPDTEDINGNGGLDLANNYFAYGFDLDTTSADAGKYLEGGDINEWKLYRLPLAEHQAAVGNPSFSRIEYARIWLDGFSAARPDSIGVAEVNLVGNVWKEIGIGASEVELRTYNQDARFYTTVVNTEENPDYLSPPGVQLPLDPIRHLRLKEQSLALRADNLRSNEIAMAAKTLALPADFTTHKRLKMFVHGKNMRLGGPAVVFFLRFGADKKNFYEFREQVFSGWDQHNEMNLDLIALSRLQFSAGDLVSGFQNYFRKQLTATQELRVLGNPALSDIRVLMAGIKNLGQQPWAGEIWLDELRLVEMKR